MSTAADVPADDPAAGLFDSIDDLADALRDDPILVSPASGGGDAEAADAYLTDLAADVDLPVYVALVEAPPDLGMQDPSGEVLSGLHDVLGDGYYVVGVPARGPNSMYGSPQLAQGGWIDGQPFEVRLDYESDVPRLPELTPVRQDGGSNVGATDAGLAAESLLVVDDYVAEIRDGGDPFFGEPDEAEVEDLADQQWAVVPDSLDTGWRADLDEPASDGLTIVVAVAVGLLVFALVWALLATVLRRQAIRREAAVDPARVHHKAVRTLAWADGVLDGVAADRRAGGAYDEADGARDVAARLVDRTADGDDVASTVGALVLAQTAGRLAEIAAEPDGGHVPYRPCFVNPLHGEAASVRRDPAAGEVPVCRRCEEDLGADRPRDVLEVPAGLRRVPYYERDDVWAETGYGALDPTLWRRVLAQEVESR